MMHEPAVDLTIRHRRDHRRLPLLSIIVYAFVLTTDAITRSIGSMRWANS
jgi:hypothetical protein